MITERQVEERKRTTDVRPLREKDFTRVLAVDEAIVGRSRRGYLEKRLQAALRHPGLHIQVAAEDERLLVGFLLARVVTGEFGRPDAAVILEAIGVEPAHQRHRVGQALLDGLEDVMRRKGIHELLTQAEWTNHALLRFLGGTGFSLAPRHILECRWPAFEQRQTEVRQRDMVRALKPEDLSEVVRIDRTHTGEDRTEYLRRKFDEVLEESAVRVSLVAETDPRPQGFVMARVDFGEYGQTEPVAVIDTIGVDPRFAREGIGRALLSQLLANLGALRVEKVETQVAWDDFGLLGFFYRSGFGPSDSLAFGKRI